ncbi:MAG: tetratricopeptide repeat protein [Bacteroidetes bacterium]|nr:tetratricopeptide repeat protein [Bacteroidota bacterium]
MTKAIDYCNKALPIFVKFLGENHPSTITVKKKPCCCHRSPQ